MAFCVKNDSVSLVTNGAYKYSLAGCVTSITYSGSGFSQNLGLTWNGQYQITEAKTHGWSTTIIPPPDDNYFSPVATTTLLPQMGG